MESAGQLGVYGYCDYLQVILFPKGLPSAALPSKTTFWPISFTPSCKIPAPSTYQLLPLHTMNALTGIVNQGIETFDMWFHQFL
jgi:hypothetical protein